MDYVKGFWTIKKWSDHRLRLFLTKQFRNYSPDLTKILVQVSNLDDKQNYLKKQGLENVVIRKT